jgi:hypothetical protein
VDNSNGIVDINVTNDAPNAEAADFGPGGTLVFSIIVFSIA